MNRLDTLFNEKKTPILSVYTVVGFPTPKDDIAIVHEACAAGADFMELGMPFSDPVADGIVIQKAHQQALAEDVAFTRLFEVAHSIREKFQTPLVAMGYMNPVFQYGIERFLADASKAGIDGLILPDLPPELYEARYKEMFEKHGIHSVFLISPNTSEERIRYIDSLSNGFVYAVSSLAVTGSATGDSELRNTYLKRLAAMSLRNPLMVGFGIKSREDFDAVSQYARGGIIGSAFVDLISKDHSAEAVTTFIRRFQ